MKPCLSDEALLQCYTGEGAPAERTHLDSCPACAGRFRALGADLALITQALEAAPPRRRRAPATGLAGWRVAASGLALAAAFTVGWSLHSSLLTQAGGGARVVREQSMGARQPIQLSALEPGVVQTGAPAPGAYAAYVQDAFGSDFCSEPDDPLEPGCL
jgi:hypothetical protein